MSPMNFPSLLHIADYEHFIDRAATEAVRSCLPHDWSEDFITRTLLRSISKPMQLKTYGSTRPMHVRWDVRKLLGTNENAFGDIAFLVKISTWANDTIEGVGFLEAKKRDFNKNTFSQIKKPQLRRINKNTPRSGLILYDYDSISTSARDTLVDARPSVNGWSGMQLQLPPQCICVPISTALAVDKKTTDLYKFGISLSEQLIRRYFCGFDLEYESGVVAAIRGFIHNPKYGLPKHLVLISVSTGSDDVSLPEYNPEMYGYAD